MNPNCNVIDDINKINVDKDKVDKIIDKLNEIKKSASDNFEGSMQFELVERINKIINDSYDLEMDFQESKNSLFKLSIDIINEEKRKEKLEEEKKLSEKK
ncbi:hypothetical protein NNC19_09600 [Clostridium sp. SHJSY1]|uniref:hypothetical protein n=1 Tax=Clostridium sp. SHJSY1 TaxID=2942483 RepID=UPI0028755EDB|nr:hypothetical protein [Clostridium sp. SHJSY1]MDS0525931.1 hypothetical protein [Clostridium sp. SHJSY1]